uniref:Protein tyrosine phosphatase non-receptor type 20 n=1 Tax=Felis catus TaxID=9685 RepID=A0ABI7WF18_FELCA
MEGEDSNWKDVISWESLPSSSQTPRSVTREVLAKEDSSEEVKFSPQSSQNDYEDILKDATESDSDPSIWATSGFLRDKWSSEDEELAGPSQTVPPQLHGIQIVSERELAQLAHVRPLIFSFREQLTIKDCFNVLEKKVAEFEILQEFMTGTSHFIKHLQFTNWPDHGTPAPVDGFIKYVRYVRKSHLTGPVLVHCSAGVGRTGVFLCVDVVFCAIEKNFPFNIKNIVAQMREQRSGMIQTKEQYCFCYKVVLEVLQKILTFD